MGITTLNGEQNWVSQLYRLKRKDNRVIFKFIRHGPCDACMEEGRGPQCPHYERMPWKSKAKDDDIKEIYRQRGQAELGEQEMSGASISPLTFIVKPIYIKQLLERPLHSFTHPPGVIHVAIDPHGGGKTSATAIIFVANDCGKYVVSQRCEYRERIAITKSIVLTYFFCCMLSALRPSLPLPWNNSWNASLNLGMNNSIARLLLLSVTYCK